MPQLAGAPCGVCQKPLMGVRDGAFCPECESPVHLECARAAGADTQPTVCRRCGASKLLAKRWREYEAACDREQDEEAAAAQQSSLPPVAQQPSSLKVVVRVAGVLLYVIVAVTLGELVYLPRLATAALIVIPWMVCIRLLNGEEKTPSHLDPTPPPASPTKGAWRAEVGPPK